MGEFRTPDLELNKALKETLLTIVKESITLPVTDPDTGKTIEGVFQGFSRDCFLLGGDEFMESLPDDPQDPANEEYWNNENFTEAQGKQRLRATVDFWAGDWYSHLSPQDQEKALQAISQDLQANQIDPRDKTISLFIYLQKRGIAVRDQYLAVQRPEAPFQDQRVKELEGLLRDERVNQIELRGRFSDERKVLQQNFEELNGKNKELKDSNSALQVTVARAQEDLANRSTLTVQQELDLRGEIANVRKQVAERIRDLEDKVELPGDLELLPPDVIAKIPDKEKAIKALREARLLLTGLTTCTLQELGVKILPLITNAGDANIGAIISASWILIQETIASHVGSNESSQQRIELITKILQIIEKQIKPDKPKLKSVILED